jgi:hypothetical protein
MAIAPKLADSFDLSGKSDVNNVLKYVFTKLNQNFIFEEYLNKQTRRL